MDASDLKDKKTGTLVPLLYLDDFFEMVSCHFDCINRSLEIKFEHCDNGTVLKELVVLFDRHSVISCRTAPFLYLVEYYDTYGSDTSWRIGQIPYVVEVEGDSSFVAWLLGSGGHLFYDNEENMRQIRHFIVHCEDDCVEVLATAAPQMIFK